MLIRKAKNLYELDAEYSYSHPRLEGIRFHNPWCKIINGTITVGIRYSHDGCTPKYEVLGLFVLGVPDGRLQKSKPATYFASLIHDVFCQFKDDINITKAATIEIFNDMLKEAQFPCRPLYVAMVEKFGPHKFKGDYHD